jgi:hypothetical protein
LSIAASQASRHHTNTPSRIGIGVSPASSIIGISLFHIGFRPVT